MAPNPPIYLKFKADPACSPKHIPLFIILLWIYPFKPKDWLISGDSPVEQIINHILPVCSHPSNWGNCSTLTVTGPHSLKIVLPRYVQLILLKTSNVSESDWNGFPKPNGDENFSQIFSRRFQRVFEISVIWLQAVRICLWYHKRLSKSFPTIRFELENTSGCQKNQAN